MFASCLLHRVKGLLANTLHFVHKNGKIKRSPRKIDAAKCRNRLNLTSCWSYATTISFSQRRQKVK